MKRVLITGITGYIGSNLARALLNRCEVYGLVRSPLTDVYISDIVSNICLLNVDGSYESVRDAVLSAKPDVVFHLAAYYTGGHRGDDIDRLIESNISFGAYLLEAMSETGYGKLIYTTTSMENYENSLYCPVNFYAATKKAFEDILEYYADTEAVEYITLVITDTYGPRDRRPKVLNIIRDAAVNGSTVDLSDGKQIYDVVYIDDMVDALILAGNYVVEGKYIDEKYQTVPARAVSLKETVELFLEKNGLTADLNWGVRKTSERTIKEKVRVFDILPGWEAKVGLEEGLVKMLEDNSL